MNDLTTWAHGLISLTCCLLSPGFLELPLDMVKFEPCLHIIGGFQLADLGSKFGRSPHMALMNLPGRVHCIPPDQLTTAELALLECSA